MTTVFQKSPVEGPEASRMPVDYQTLNRNALWTVGLTVVFALILASMTPAPLIPAAMNSLLFFGAFGAVILAVIRRERLSEPYISAWDQALMLMFGSLLAGLFVDPAQVAAIVQETGAAVGAGQ
jgi:hypothetical protein